MGKTRCSWEQTEALITESLSKTSRSCIHHAYLNLQRSAFHYRPGKADDIFSVLVSMLTSSEDLLLCFSILGMHIFGCKFSLRTETGDTVPDRKNFDSLLWAIVTVFQVINMSLAHKHASTYLYITALLMIYVSLYMQMTCTYFLKYISAYFIHTLTCISNHLEL